MKTIQLRVGLAALFSMGMLVATPVLAAEATFVAEGKPVVGSEWKVHFMIDTPSEKINTLGGALLYPTSTLEVDRIEESKSIMNLWVERPAAVNGTIPFAGITPGGFVGHYEVFTVVFTVKKALTGTLSVNEPVAYLNDGLGTETDWFAESYDFTAVASTAKKAKVTDKKVTKRSVIIGPFVLRNS
jgi:hypothetical protein